MHIADGVDVYHQRHEGHHHHHHCRKRIDQKSDVELHAVADHPGVEITVEAVAVHDVVQNHKGTDAGNDHQADSDAMARRAANEATE